MDCARKRLAAQALSGRDGTSGGGGFGAPLAFCVRDGQRSRVAEERCLQSLGPLRPGAARSPTSQHGRIADQTRRRAVEQGRVGQYGYAPELPGYSVQEGRHGRCGAAQLCANRQPAGEQRRLPGAQAQRRPERVSRPPLGRCAPHGVGGRTRPHPARPHCGFPPRHEDHRARTRHGRTAGVHQPRGERPPQPPTHQVPELAALVQLKGAITRQVNRIARESKETSQ